MLNIHLIVVLLALYEFSYVPGGEAGDGELDEALNTKLDRFIYPINLCPAESESEIKKLKKISNNYTYILKYCLFQKLLKSNEERFCQTEMNPIFKVYLDADNDPIKCGPADGQVLHFFGYFYCGSMDEGLNQLLNVKNQQQLTEFFGAHQPENIQMYDVCYNMVTHEADYTEHTIFRPWIYQNERFQEEVYFPNSISTDPFYMESKRFSNIESYYAAQQKINPNKAYRMSPQPMVPPQHYGYRTWKKTTNHIINTAPLWEDLVPLMTVIDEGIKKAALSVYQNQGRELLIFTKVVKFPQPQNATEKLLNIKSRTFQPNIWSKFIYDAVRQQGVMIYIHSTPGQAIQKKCTYNDEVSCRFQTWLTVIASSSGSSSAPPDNFEYAYCCQITKQEAEEMFPYKSFTIETFLDIDSIITL